MTTHSDAPFLPTYGRFPLNLVRGEGHRVQADDGRWYLDAICDIAVTSLGHGHPRVVAAVQDQAARLLHTSNLYRVPVQTAFAEKLVEVMDAAGVFLCNSGTEANEAAIKLVRKHHWRAAGKPSDGNSPRTEVLVAENAFHGRSLMSLALTPRKKYQEGFGPLPGGVRCLPVAELAGAVTEATAAVILEPVQGEGGCWPVPPDVLAAVRAACDATGALLIYDEIQCGLGRTGELIHHPRPDAITMAKALGGGLPLGALVVVNPALVDTLGPGDHGSTFGGNPRACAAGLATLETIVDDDLPARCAALGALLRGRLEAGGATVRGRGLMLAAAAEDPGAVTAKMRDEYGILVCSAGPSAVRMLPAFTSSEDEINALADALLACLPTAAGA